MHSNFGTFYRLGNLTFMGLLWVHIPSLQLPSSIWIALLWVQVMYIKLGPLFEGLSFQFAHPKSLASKVLAFKVTLRWMVHPVYSIILSCSDNANCLIISQHGSFGQFFFVMCLLFNQIISSTSIARRSRWESYQCKSDYQHV